MNSALKVFTALIVTLILTFGSFSHVSASATNGMIAIAHQTAGQPATIRLFSPAGQLLQDLHVAQNASDQITSPAWSPDGTRLAFMKNGYAYVMSADGSNMVQLSHTYVDPNTQWALGYAPEPGIAWSPDGSQLAFTTLDGIYIINTDGTGEHRIRDANGSVSWNDMLISTTVMGATANGVATGGFMTIKPNGTVVGAPFQYYFDDNIAAHQAAWSPDGTRFIVPARAISDTNVDLYASNTDGSNFHQLTTPPQNGWNLAYPCWSPDGTQIAYVAQQNFPPYATSFYAENLSSGVSSQINIDNTGIYSQCSWQPLTTTKLIPVYRFYIAQTYEHFWTTDVNERNSMINAGYQYEGLSWYSSTDTSMLPVYRLYAPSLRQHLYTTDSNEKNALTSSGGWQYEGISQYVSSSPNYQPVYRLYAPSLAVHLLTADANERSVLVASGGWRDEGVAWYQP